MYDLDVQRDALRQLRNQARFGNGVKVAVLDGAVDPAHPDLAAHQLEAADHEQRTLHGTAVASIIAGKRTGVAPSVEILAIPVFEEDQNGTLQGCSERVLAKAIKTAVEAGAHVINVSGAHLSNTGQPSDEMRDAVDACVAANVQLIAAVGNNGLSVDTVPACVQQVLAVGAHDISGDAAAFNNYGPMLRKKMFLAPGVDIRFAHESRNSSISGSSFSAPVVSGIVALMRALSSP
jgi:subtilisin family serine protease